MSDVKKITGVGLAGIAGVIAGWIGVSRVAVDHNMAVPVGIRASRYKVHGETTGTMSYYVDRTTGGRPLVLIHSINAAASAYEMRPLFNHYRNSRPVFAPDLPGFGLSDRTKRTYTPDLYEQAILDLLESEVQEPADVIALSLGSEFAARAALRRPDLFHSLTMISPTGFQIEPKTDSSDRFFNVASFPLWSQAFFDLLTTKPVIHYYLQKSFAKQVDEGLAEYAHRMAHQPNARYAPLHFIGGKLFTPHIRENVYERLEIPVLVLYDRDKFTSFDTLPDVVARHENWRAERITPSWGLPQFDELEQTTQALEHFWLSVPQYS